MLRTTKSLVIIAEGSIKNNSQKQKVEKIYTKVPNPYPEKWKEISIISRVFGEGKDNWITDKESIG